MKAKIRSDDQFSAKYHKLIEPMFKANHSLLRDLLEVTEIKEIIREARSKDKLNIPKNGRKPNTPKSFLKKINALNIPEGLILNYTITYDERQILHKYVNMIISKFDVYEHFRTSIEIYIIHNLILAPAHNVTISLKVKGNGKTPIPELHFGRFPYGNDYKVADLLLKNNQQIQRHIPDKFKKSYRGSINQDSHLRIIREASDRRRVSESLEKHSRETYNIKNSEIADIVYEDSSKEEVVKKVLYRHKKRAKELTSSLKGTLR